MHFFVNKGMGHSNSGVEHAQFYRAARFKESNLPFKYIFTDYLPQLHQHMSEWQIAENDVIGLYDFFLSDDPRQYLRDGEAFQHTYHEDVLYDTKGVQRLVIRQTTGNFKATTYKKRFYDSSTSREINVDHRVILKNGQHQMSWHYLGTGNHKRMVNIHLNHFYEDDYFFATYEALLLFFYQQLERVFHHNVYFIDRGSDNEEVLVQLKSQQINLKIVAIIHAAHFVSKQGGHLLWNNHYQYLFDHLDQIDAVVVSTMLQKQDILKQLAFLGNTNISDKLYAIPVGGVDRVPKARHLFGDAIRFVTASRLHAEKNISHIILALAQLQANGISATLTIYGSGADEQNIRRLIYDEQMMGSVKINGLSQNLSEELQAYDAFVSASYSEGFGLTYVEAMAQGLPIVSYQNSYGAQTLIRPNENGILVPITDDKDKNVAALALAMRRLLTVYDTLSIGQQNVAKAFTNQQISTAWEKLVGDLR